MIYFDNAATTLWKPAAVGAAVAAALGRMGNAGRSFHAPAMLASRSVLAARRAVAGLAGLESPAQVAFTSGATESLNLTVDSLIPSGAHVVTSVLEHNAVLRPLYRRGCALSYLNCDDNGALDLDGLPGLLRPDTRALVLTHGSNVLGSVTRTDALRIFCQAHGLLLILDCAQTMGAVPVRHDMADVLCFTGHKALYGPQGTGGVLARAGLPFTPVKSGGAGFDSFAAHHPLNMPDVFEAGTQNAHGLCGLAEGIRFVQREGVSAIQAKEAALCGSFLEGLRDIPGVHVYGGKGSAPRLSIVSLNIGDFSSEEAALRLWEGWEIATRPGIHCAPLVHQRFGTERRGMVRFSFGYANTPEEIGQALKAVRSLAAP